MVAASMTTRPHDALFKAAFAAPADAAPLLRELLPHAVREAVAWETLDRETPSLVDPRLADRHGDLLFSVRIRTGEAGRVYLLLEHQSTGDTAMPLRALSFQTRIWERCRTEQPHDRLPPVIAVLVSHVRGGWTVARSLDELLDPAVVEIPGLAGLVPRCAMIVEDLAHRTNDDLKARPLAAFQQLALWLLRDARDPARLLDNFDAWSAELIEVQAGQERGGIDRFAVLITYLFRVVDPVTLDELRAKLRKLGPGPEEAAMTIAEYLHEQGRAEGRAEGRIDTLRRQLVFKFQSLDGASEARLKTATPEMIDRYLQRVLIADSLAAVFED